MQKNKTLFVLNGFPIPFVRISSLFYSSFYFRSSRREILSLSMIRFTFFHLKSLNRSLHGLKFHEHFFIKFIIVTTEFSFLFCSVKSLFTIRLEINNTVSPGISIRYSNSNCKIDVYSYPIQLYNSIFIDFVDLNEVDILLIRTKKEAQ